MLLMPIFGCSVHSSLFPEDFMKNVNYDYLENFRKREVQVYAKKGVENKYLNWPETRCLFLSGIAISSPILINFPLFSFRQDKQPT